jgi:hypothetical protein
MKNKVEDLRNHLFAQLEKLSDEDCNLEEELKRSSAMVAVAEQIIDSSRAETEFIKATTSNASDSTGFFPIAKEQRKYFIEKEVGKSIEEEDEEPKKIERPKAEYTNKSYTHGQHLEGDDID